MSYDRIYNLMTSEELEKLSIIETEKLRSLRSEAAKVAILERDLDECKAHLKAAGTLMGQYKDAAIALEPEAEAWRAVRKARDEGSIGGPPISHWITEEVERQIARLDAMKEGESNGV